MRVPGTGPIRAVGPVVFLLWIGLGFGALARAQLAHVSGSIDVARVEAEFDGNNQDTIQQRYNINASREITRTIDLRASLRYFQFDVDGAERLGVFRREWQPSGELSWRHHWFRFSSTAQRRSVRSPLTSGDLITESFAIDWESTAFETHSFKLRYDLQEVQDTGSESTRDTRDGRLLANWNLRREHESLEYSFTRRETKNIVRGLTSRENAHQVRFLGSHTLDDAARWRFDSQYLFTRRDRRDDVETGERLLEQVSVVQTLFAIDPEPTLDALEPLQALNDGNTGTPTLPAVEIGAGAANRNIGMDFGAEREALSAVYVYVDRFSSAALGWQVYTSDDNLIWTLAVTSPIRRFNPALLRYELEFTAVAGRYLKVVNDGANDIAGVLVTEVQAFEERIVLGDVESDASTHLLSTSLRWRARPSLELSLDNSVRIEPEQGSFGDREGYDYALRGRWRPTDTTQWLGRIEQTWQRFGHARPTLRDDFLSATFLYDPLPTLGTTASSSYRRSSESGVGLQDIVSLFAEANAEPIPALDIVVEALVSRVDQLQDDASSDIWTLRSSLDTEITQTLHVLGSWSHQQTTTFPEDELRVRRLYTLSVDFRITSRLFARAGLSWVDDDRFSRRQDYLLNWSPGPRVSLTAQMVLDDASGNFQTDRASLNATVDINSRASLYLRYSDLDQTGFTNERITSWQQGLRVSF